MVMLQGMVKGLEGVATAPPLAVAGVTAGADHLAGEVTAGTTCHRQWCLACWVHCDEIICLCLASLASSPQVTG